MYNCHGLADLGVSPSGAMVKEANDEYLYLAG
jgi:hypothetical protein